MLRNLKLWQKLTALGVAFSIPAVVLVLLLRQEKQIAIEFSTKEQIGNHYLVALRQVLDGVPTYGLTGDNASAARVESGFRALDAAERQHGLQLGTAQRVALLRDQWGKTQGAATAQERAARAEQLIQSIVDSYAYVGDSSNLILDPDLDSYYAMDAVVNHLPQNQRNLYGVMRLVRTLPLDRPVNPQERMQLLVELGRLRQGQRRRRRPGPRRLRGGGAAGLRGEQPHRGGDREGPRRHPRRAHRRPDQPPLPRLRHHRQRRPLRRVHRLVHRRIGDQADRGGGPRGRHARPRRAARQWAPTKWASCSRRCTA
jgi:hypothetical protein